MSELVMAILGIGFGAVAGTGITTVLTRKVEDKQKQELEELRDELYEISKVNERADRILNESYEKNLGKDKDLRNEISYLRRELKDIKEGNRRFLFSELARVREELSNLSLMSKDADKELRLSYKKRLLTEKGVKEEIDSLTKRIVNIRFKIRKDLLDKVQHNRDILYKLSIYNDKASEILKESGDRSFETEELIMKEIKRLEKSIKEIEESTREELLLKLKLKREQLFKLSKDSDKAKEILNNSYAKRLLSNKDLVEEIDEISGAIDEVKIELRRVRFTELEDVRSAIYRKDSFWINEALDESYNRILEDEVIPKEIERLKGINEKIEREEMLERQRRKIKF